MFTDPTLDWWTMLLQLLVDDNADVRHEASKLICKIKPCNELVCIENTLLIFFQKFNKIVAKKQPEIALSALFCWSISLLADADYEMDETDVSKHALLIISYNWGDPNPIIKITI